MLIPDSAHGTNPASARFAGFEVKELLSNAQGTLDLADLEREMTDEVAALMLTVPNTLGVFEDQIREIAEIVHGKGGFLYCDGANFNAFVGKARPGDMGIDVLHMNLHKTFTTPHGGGGPGAGPVGVSRELVPFLPVPTVERDESGFYLDIDRPHSIGRIRSFHGQFGMLVRALTYILAMGGEGLAPGRRERGAQRQLHPQGAARAPTTCRTTRRRCTRWSSPTRSSTSTHDVDHPRHRQAADGLRLPPADHLLPADRLRRPDDRADRDGGPAGARPLHRRR